MKYNKILLSILCLLTVTGCATTLPSKDKKPVDTTSTTEVETPSSTPVKAKEYFDNYNMECSIRNSEYTIKIPQNSILLATEEAAGFEIYDKDGNKIDVLTNILTIDNENPTTELLSEVQNFMTVGKQLLNSNEIKHNFSLKDIQSVNIDTHEGLYNSGCYELTNGNVNYVVYILEFNTDKRDKKDILELMVESGSLGETDLKDIAKILIEKVGVKNE